MKISLYDEFPRVIGYPIRQKIINDINELNSHIKEFISKTDIHLSLYSFSTLVREKGVLKPDYFSANINKVYFDLDEGDFVQNAKDLHHWCIDNEILHKIHLSSYSGIHFFIGCNSRIQFKKTALYNFQTYLARKFDIRVEKGLSTLGDIARSFRVENTYNFKRDCYCVPITKDELLSIGGINDSLLKKLTLKPKKGSIWYGKKMVNLLPFDKEKYLYKVIKKVEININDVINKYAIKSEIMESFPPCIRHWISLEKKGYKKRYLITLYLREQNMIEMNNVEIVSFLKTILSNDEWRHCATNEKIPGHNLGEGLLPIKKTLENLSYKMPSCFQLDSMGLCPEKCGRWHPIYE